MAANGRVDAEYLDPAGASYFFSVKISCSERLTNYVFV